MSTVSKRAFTILLCPLVILAAFAAHSLQPVHAQAAAITIQNFSFQPGTVTIPVGTTVTWTNMDTPSHTTTSDPGQAVSWDSGVLATNQSFSFTFTQAGTFTYHCSIHPNMHGTIVVQAASPGGSTATTAPVSTATTIPVASATSPPLAAYPVRTHQAKKTIKASEAGGKYVFAPAKTTIKAGTKVTWMNPTDAPHTVTATSSNWKLDKQLPQNGKVTFVFAKAGTYKYVCKYHPGMAGAIVVK